MSWSTAWLIPVPLPVSLISVRTAAPSAGSPEQPVTPVKEVLVVPVYAHVPVPPSTVKVPVELNQKVDATFKVPDVRSWPAPLIVVAKVLDCASRSTDEPVNVVLLRSMLPLTPRIVVVMPNTLCPSP